MSSSWLNVLQTLRSRIVRTPLYGIILTRPLPTLSNLSHNLVSNFHASARRILYILIIHRPRPLLLLHPLHEFYNDHARRWLNARTRLVSTIRLLASALFLHALYHHCSGIRDGSPCKMLRKARANLFLRNIRSRNFHLSRLTVMRRHRSFVGPCHLPIAHQLRNARIGHRHRHFRSAVTLPAFDRCHHTQLLA